jgi:hypothetical protein
MSDQLDSLDQLALRAAKGDFGRRPLAHAGGTAVPLQAGLLTRRPRLLGYLLEFLTGV